MSLKLGIFKVQDAQFGSKTNFENRMLTINKPELLTAIEDDSCFKKMDIEIVKPGESTRIIHVLDAVQPRFKVSGGSAFPGMTGKMKLAGTGVTHCLEGSAVLVSCEREKGMGNVVHESVIEMTGPGADFSLFSSLYNIVLICEAVAGLGDAEFGKATRLAGLKAAEYIGKTTKNLQPEWVKEYNCNAQQAQHLPKVAYIYLVQSQGFLRQTFVYGADMNSSLPVILHPQEVLDGAVVSGNYVIGAQKNPTYLHTNHPLVLELLNKHGRELDFVGVILANEHSLLEEKERSAMMSAKQASFLGADGVVITKEGGGNTYTDLMLTCRECEKLGINTVIMTNEVAGPDGDQPPLVDSTPEANAIVSTGNMDQVIQLPQVEKVIGGNRIDGISTSATAAFSTGLGRLYTSTSPIGAYKLTALRN